MARRCGAKHIFESNYAKDLMAGPILPLLIRKNATPLWRQAHLCVKMWKNSFSRARFGRFDPAKRYAAVARSAFSSQNVKTLTGVGHFLKIRYQKIARRCGSKHICKSKCTKHLRAGAIFEVPIQKNCTPCGAKHIFKSKCAKHHTLGPLFEVPMSKNGTPLWREAHLQGKMYKTPAFCSILRGSN